MQGFADRLHCGAEPQAVRQTLEAGLIPVVKRILRTGAGVPHLVQWVRTTLSQMEAGRDAPRPVDPERDAPPLARLLSAALLRRQLGRPALAPDTLVGA
jgi:hypothetical protein